MEILTILFNSYKSIILLAGSLIILAYIVYKISQYITKEANTIEIKVENKANLEITVYEDGRTTMNTSYPDTLKKLFKTNKKLPPNATYLDFLNTLPTDYLITYEYTIKYINNQNEEVKRIGSTSTIEEIEKQITNLIKYH